MDLSKWSINEYLIIENTDEDDQRNQKNYA